MLCAEILLVSVGRDWITYGDIHVQLEWPIPKTLEPVLLYAFDTWIISRQAEKHLKESEM